MGDVGMRGGETVAGRKSWQRLSAIGAVALLQLRRLDAIAALDHIGLEGDGSGATVKLEEETAGIAEDAAGLVTSPQRCRRGTTVLTDGL